MTSVSQLSTLFGDDDATKIVNAYGGDDRVLVIHTNNVADNHVPMTPWIVAHRTAHMYYDHFTDEHFQEWTASMVQAVDELYYGPDDINSYETALEFAYDVMMDDFEHNNMGRLMSRMTTMKSGRNQTQRDVAEMFFEMMAQHIVTGKMTLGPFPKLDGDRPIIATPERTIELHDALEADFNKRMKTVILQSYGAILII